MKINKIVALGLVLAMTIGLSGCDMIGRLFAIEFSGNITTATTTKAGTYTVTSGFTVSAVWTIAPGTTFIMEPDAWIDVDASGSIIALGTAAKPITFTSSKPVPAKGDWYGIDDEGNGSNYVYCTIEHARTGLELNGSLYTVQNSSFNMNTSGLDMDNVNSMTALSSNSFTSNDEPMTINSSFDIDNTNTFTGNANQRVSHDGQRVTADRSWSVTSVPIYSTGFYVEATLTLVPGVTISMAPDGWLEVEDIGTLKAVGTSAAPITFTSSKPVKAAGDWDGIDIEGNGCEIKYCVIEYADTAIDLWVDTLALSNSTIKYNTIGIDKNGYTLDTTLSNTISDNGNDIEL